VRNRFPKLCASAVALLGFGFAPAHAQTTTTLWDQLPLKAALVFTPEFCKSRLVRGGVSKNPKRGLEVGKAACAEMDLVLRGAFTDLTVVDDVKKASGAQVVLIPEFVDLSAKLEGVTAFSNQDLTLFLQWTAKDSAGKVVWLETVQGSATRHIGNIFTAEKNKRLITDEAVKNVADASAAKMASSPELKNLGH